MGDKPKQMQVKIFFALFILDSFFYHFNNIYHKSKIQRPICLCMNDMQKCNFNYPNALNLVRLLGIVKVIINRVYYAVHFFYICELYKKVDKLRLARAGT